MKYKAVIFDLGGTLIPETPWAEKNAVVRQIASVLSAPPDDFIRIWHDTFDIQMKGVHQDFPSFVGQICQKLGVNPKDERLINLAGNILFENTRRHIMNPREGAIETLQILKNRSYKIGLISNCNNIVAEVWGETPFAPFIDIALFSCSEGMMKPDPRLFQLAIEKLAVTPGECIFVADGIADELVGAAWFGMYPVMISVPGENENDPYREEWSGPVISSLAEVLDLVR